MSVLCCHLSPESEYRQALPGQGEVEYLYWEYRTQTAVRMNDWKAIRPRPYADWELYDLGKDISEQTNIAAHHPRVMAKMIAFSRQAHEPVRKGTYSDRTFHEKDRWAKWGDSRD